MEELQIARSVNVDYLYAYVSTNSIVRDRDATITNYRYQMRRVQTNLDALNENVETIRDILDNYQNDQIVVSGQEEDAARSISSTTDYYNRLIMEQANTYDKIARLEEQIADLQYKLDSLYAAEADGIGAEERQNIIAELSEALRVCRSVYAQIRELLEEIHESSLFTVFAEHTTPQGETANFLSAAAKKMLIGGIAGAVIACGIWLFSAFVEEFRGRAQKDGEGEEEAE
jgi:site-specific recombinase XerD